MKHDLTTFGETMVRISTRPGRSLAAADRVQLYTGGTESNTAAALARLGLKAAWVSRLPDNPLGRRIAADLSRHGVDVSGVVWAKNERAGIYFVEFAAPPRSTTVTYDRKNSAVSRLKPRELDWKFLLNTRILHLTGITPALSATCARAVAEAVKKARAKKVPVSFDVNYRARLWSPATAAKSLEPIMRGVTLLVMTKEDARTVFQLSGEPDEIVRAMRKRFDPKIAVLTMGGDGALAFDGKKIIKEPGFPNVAPIDRLGAGDAFTAGLIFGFLRHNLALGLKYGIAMSAMKMGMSGDYFWSGRDEVEEVVRNRGGDVRR
jgi:2-dehydro-3-deoxygluconokinase